MSAQEDSRSQATGGTTTPSGAVLLSDEITRLCHQPTPLIVPFYDNDDYLKPASYHLSVGDSIKIDGEDFTLSQEDPTREIPPHGIAMIRTLEQINLPPDLIARWNIRVTEVYNGLIWVGGPQVDPGYSGTLICPVFNLSTKPYKLVLGKRLFTIDFVRTTPFNEATCKKFIRKRDPASIISLDKYNTQSAPKQKFDQLENRFLDTEKEIKGKLRDASEASNKRSEHIENEIRDFRNLSFVALSVIVTAITILAVLGVGTVTWDPAWLPLPLSIFSLLFAAFALIISLIKVSRSRGKRD